MFKYQNSLIRGCVKKDHLYTPEYGLGYRLQDFGWPRVCVGRDEEFGIRYSIYEYHIPESPEELALALKKKGLYPLTKFSDLVEELQASISPL